MRLDMIKFITLMIFKTAIAILLSVIMILLIYVIYGFPWTDRKTQLLLFTSLFFIYLLPCIICRINKNKSEKTIVILNLGSVIFGLAWPVAFVWSLTKSFPSRKSYPPPLKTKTEQEVPSKKSDIYN
jgi:hypothetical protein